ncbi:uncharacterized protein METZ01_LOCUS463587, partial [marine metagenome]
MNLCVIAKFMCAIIRRRTLEHLSYVRTFRDWLNGGRCRSRTYDLMRVKHAL